jgi:parvulin-like peptidyl-prolyl isomerase
MVEAGFSIAAVGDLFPQVIRTADGFHIVRLVSRRDPFTRSFEEASPELEQRIRKDELAAGRDAFIAALKEKSKVELDKEALEAARLDLRGVASGKQKSETVPTTPQLPGR